jgi:hypothetical protein
MTTCKRVSESGSAAGKARTAEIRLVTDEDSEQKRWP